MSLSPRSAANLAQILRGLEQLTLQVQTLTRRHGATGSGLVDTGHGEEQWEPPPLRLPPAARTGKGVDPVYVVFDFETNGLGKTEDIRVCQVGAQALNIDLHTLGTFNEFVNPLAAIDPKASAVNGINPKFVSKCDAWDDVGDRFNKWMNSVRDSTTQPIVMLAHNGKRFDARM